MSKDGSRNRGRWEIRYGAVIGWFVAGLWIFSLFCLFVFFCCFFFVCCVCGIDGSVVVGVFGYTSILTRQALLSIANVWWSEMRLVSVKKFLNYEALAIDILITFSLVS